MRHLLIVGPGRAGTSFLVQLLTRLGYDTGMVPYHEPVSKETRAGAEFFPGDLQAVSTEDLKRKLKSAPWVLKSPDMSFHLKAWLLGGILEAGCAIIPVRDAVEATYSRLETELYWGVAERNFLEQWKAHYWALGAAVEACALAEVPMCILRFPRLVRDWRYLHHELSHAIEKGKWQDDADSIAETAHPITGLVTTVRFQKEFEKLADPGLSKHTGRYQQSLEFTDRGRETYWWKTEEET